MIVRSFTQTPWNTWCEVFAHFFSACAIFPILERRMLVTLLSISIGMTMFVAWQTPKNTFRVVVFRSFDTLERRPFLSMRDGGSLLNTLSPYVLAPSILRGFVETFGSTIIGNLASIAGVLTSVGSCWCATRGPFCCPTIALQLAIVWSSHTGFKTGIRCARSVALVVLLFLFFRRCLRWTPLPTCIWYWSGVSRIQGMTTSPLPLVCTRSTTTRLRREMDASCRTGKFSCALCSSRMFEESIVVAWPRSPVLSVDPSLLLFLNSEYVDTSLFSFY